MINPRVKDPLCLGHFLNNCGAYFWVRWLYLRLPPSHLFFLFWVLKALLFTLYPVLYLAQFLDQCCPTLSPFATCGDKIFSCGDRQLLKNEFLMINKLHISLILAKVAKKNLSRHNFGECGDRENLVGHHYSRLTERPLAVIRNFDMKHGVFFC